MKLGVIPESPIEQIALWAGLVPVPLLETHLAATLAQAITAGVRLGVFECLKDGPRTNLEIADHMHLSHHTVKEHVSSLYRKLGVRNRTGAVHRARRLGLLG